MGYAAVLDANVLYPASLRDTLLRLAAAGFYDLLWSERIQDEAERNLVGLRSRLPTGARTHANRCCATLPLRPKVHTQRSPSTTTDPKPRRQRRRQGVNFTVMTSPSAIG
jgi:PIN domain